MATTTLLDEVADNLKRSMARDIWLGVQGISRPDADRAAEVIYNKYFDPKRPAPDGDSQMELDLA